MEKEGKVWGTNYPLLKNGFVDMARIEINKGGVCSKHKHQYRYNYFFVESGSLLIRAWKNDYGLVDETVLNAGDYLEVPPNEYHQFEALEDTVCFEVYYPHSLTNPDIVRESCGYIGNE